MTIHQLQLTVVAFIEDLSVPSPDAWCRTGRLKVVFSAINVFSGIQWLLLPISCAVAQGIAPTILFATLFAVEVGWCHLSNVPLDLAVVSKSTIASSIPSNICL